MLYKNIGQQLLVNSLMKCDGELKVMNTGTDITPYPG